MNGNVNEVDSSEAVTFFAGKQLHPEWPRVVLFGIGGLIVYIGILLMGDLDRAPEDNLGFIFIIVGYAITQSFALTFASNARDIVIAGQYIAFRDNSDNYREYSWGKVKRVLLIGSGGRRFLRVQFRFGWPWAVRDFAEFDPLLEEIEMRAGKKLIHRSLAGFWLVPTFKALTLAVILLSLFFSILPGD